MVELWVVDLLVKWGYKKFTALKVPPFPPCVVFHKVIEGVWEVELDRRHICIGVSFKRVFLVGVGSGWQVLHRVLKE